MLGPRGCWSIGDGRIGASSGDGGLAAALGLTLGGIPGVLVAVWLVRSLPLDIVRWGVVGVVLYTGLAIFDVMLMRRTIVAGPDSGRCSASHAGPSACAARRD